MKNKAIFQMSEDQKKVLEPQLWNIANTLRCKVNVDEFRDYILSFIFYKYLSERMDMYASSILKADKIKYRDIKENTKQGKEYMYVIRKKSLEKMAQYTSMNNDGSELLKIFRSIILTTKKKLITHHS